MSTKNEQLEKEQVVVPFPLPRLPFSLPNANRLLIEYELFKLFPNGEYVYNRTENISKHKLFHTPVIKSKMYLEFNYFLMGSLSSLLVIFFLISTSSFLKCLIGLD